MALRCLNCNKGVMYGHNVSHAKNRTRKKFRPNLHAARVEVAGISRRVRLCTKCLRMYKRSRQEMIKTAPLVAPVAV
jgi:large subunit ribosomal protein L28